MSWPVCQCGEGDPNDVYRVAVKTDGMKTVQIKRNNDLSSFQHFIIDFANSPKFPAIRYIVYSIQFGRSVHSLYNYTTSMNIFLGSYISVMGTSLLYYIYYIQYVCVCMSVYIFFSACHVIVQYTGRKG